MEFNKSFLLFVHIELFLILRSLGISGALLKCEYNSNIADDEEIAVVSRDSSHKIVLYKSENLTFCDSINKCSRIGYRLPVLNTQTLQEKLQSLATANISGEDVRVWLPVSRIDGWRYINESLTLCGDPCNTLSTDRAYAASFYPLAPFSSTATRRPFICLHGRTDYQSVMSFIIIYRGRNSKYWYDAQNTCIRNHNGSLPPVIDIPTNIGLEPDAYWIGLLYRPWVWVPRKDTTNLEDDTHVSYTSWENAAIDDTNDTCVYADINDDGKWGLDNCNTTLKYYICEVEEFSPTSAAPENEAESSEDSLDISTVTTTNIPKPTEPVLSTNPLTPAVVVLAIIVLGLLGVVIGQHIYWKKRTKSAEMIANSGNIEYEDTADAMAAFPSDVSRPGNRQPATPEPVSYEQVNLREVAPAGGSPYSNLHLYERP